MRGGSRRWRLGLLLRGPIDSLGSVAFVLIHDTTLALGWDGVFVLAAVWQGFLGDSLAWGRANSSINHYHELEQIVWVYSDF